jgi:hypothetical protein
MTKLSISQAWNETVEILKRDAGALFIIAFALVALPQVILTTLTPDTPQAEPSGGTAALMLVLVVAILVLSLAGSIAISALALGRERVVGSAIALGLRRFLPLLGASLLLGILAVVVALPILMLAGVGLKDLGTPSGADAGRIALAMLALIAVFVALWARFMLMTPAAASGPGGPVAIMRRSWQLTRGHSLRLIGFILLILIGAMVLMLAITSVFGIILALVFGAPDSGSLGGILLLLVNGVVNAAFLVVLTTAVARVYAQLDAGTPDVPATVPGDAIGT